jgi:hypothetical protein
MQSGVPVAPAVASSRQTRLRPGSRSLKKPGPRSRQLALVSARQPLLHSSNRPSRTNARARTKLPNKKSQMVALRLQILFTQTPSQRSPGPAPVLAPTVTVRGRPKKGIQLERNTLQIRPTRTSGWSRSRRTDTTEPTVGIEKCEHNLEGSCMIGNVVDCRVSVWSGCALCCSPRFTYVFAFPFLSPGDGVPEPLDTSVSNKHGGIYITHWPADRGRRREPLESPPRLLDPGPPTLVLPSSFESSLFSSSLTENSSGLRVRLA